MFADDIVLCGDDETDMTEYLETWRKALEERGMRINRPKTQFMDFNFGQDNGQEREPVKILGEELQRVHHVNHFGTTGRCSGPAHYDFSIRQAARAAFVTSSFKIFLTQTFPRCGATCFILPSRAMTHLFNGVNFVYRSVEVYLTFCSYLQVLVRIRNFYNGGRY